MFVNVDNLCPCKSCNFYVFITPRELDNLLDRTTIEMVCINKMIQKDVKTLTIITINSIDVMYCYLLYIQFIMQSNVVPDAMPRTIPMTTANMRPEIETLTAINKLTGLGALQRKQIPKNPRLLWKWVGGSRSHSDFLFGKSSQNSPKPLLIFWSGRPIPCVCCL